MLSDPSSASHLEARRVMRDSAAASSVTRFGLPSADSAAPPVGGWRGEGWGVLWLLLLLWKERRGGLESCASRCSRAAPRGRARTTPAGCCWWDWEGAGPACLARSELLAGHSLRRRASGAKKARIEAVARRRLWRWLWGRWWRCADEAHRQGPMGVATARASVARSLGLRDRAAVCRVDTEEVTQGSP